MLGVMMCMKHAAPIMLRQRSGSLITVASGSGLRAGTAGHVYSASKAAAIHLTRSAAAELSQHGIRANSISPGGIVTGIFAKTAGVSGADADRVDVIDVGAQSGQFGRGIGIQRQPDPQTGIGTVVAMAIMERLDEVADRVAVDEVD